MYIQRNVRKQVALIFIVYNQRKTKGVKYKIIVESDENFFYLKCKLIIVKALYYNCARCLRIICI